MRLAANAERIHNAGAEVIAISVNPDERQAGMRNRWRLGHQLLVSDPGGDRYLQALDLFDPEERGGIARPGLLVLTPDGTEAYRYRGRDFADRTTDDDMLATLEGLGLTAIDPPAGGPDVAVPDDLEGFFGVEALHPYFRGNMFAAIAIGRRVEDPAAVEIAKEHRRMVTATLDAWTAIKDQSE